MHFHANTLLYFILPDSISIQCFVSIIGTVVYQQKKNTVVAVSIVSMFLVSGHRQISSNPRLLVGTVMWTLTPSLKMVNTEWN